MSNLTSGQYILGATGLEVLHTSNNTGASRRLESVLISGYRGFNGNYKVAGYCLDALTLAPLQKQVFICPELSPVLCIASTFSDPITGYFEFLNLSSGTYIIQGHDQLQVVNDVVFAIVSSVHM